MEQLILLYTGILIILSGSCNSPVPNRSIVNSANTDSLPTILAKDHADLVVSQFRNEAIFKFAGHQLPANLKEWELLKLQLKNEIIEKAGITVDHKLPLDYHETGSVQMEGYTIKNIFFQTLPGLYATANLYIPDGDGPFPGVINMNGHWTEAKMAPPIHSVGQTLALNGYVCLNIDAFGAGERGTIPGVFEYHGGNLGASMMNIGKSLQGIQVSENIRGIDLLCSLPYVDTKKIGATGASGGGNQTMWITAMDDRVQASVPVCSVGTFEAYIMRSNCVCELLIDGLTLTEESGILSLVAPRAILLLNHNQDANPTFNPSEMLRSYTNAKPVFELYGVGENISYQLFDLPHGYDSQDREAMLGWFNLHLKGKGNGLPIKEIAFKNLPSEQLMVFVPGNRDPKVASVQEYCKLKGEELRSGFLSTKTIDIDLKKKELRDLLRINENLILKEIHQYSGISGWDRYALETSDGKLVPLLHLAPANKSLGYTILCNPEGKNSISPSLIGELMKKGAGIVIVDLSGTGEVTSTASLAFDKIRKLHTLSRAELWLGKTVLGEWVKELDLVIQFLDTNLKARKVSVDGSKEAGLAGLFLGALEGNVDQLVLRDAPASYLFDSREGLDFFSMGIHLPGFLQWGDVSLVSALSGKNVQFINPVTMSGNAINGEKLTALESEFEKMRTLSGQSGKTTFK
ncbi:MAG: acetylxylan esterase [Prolixibacteraceae bacterium]|jgi:hypothetical protein|nr:acetylxylan esterase [Prolixibacteraceae bacterium]